MALIKEEAEYITFSVEIHEAMWLWKLLAGIFDLELEPTLIHCDNQSCMNITEKPILVKRIGVELKYMSTDEQIVDILTKPLSRMKYEYFKDKLRVL